eukprot:1576732-Rhodomonas_salina.1
MLSAGNPCALSNFERARAPALSNLLQTLLPTCCYRQGFHPSPADDLYVLHPRASRAASSCWTLNSATLAFAAALVDSSFEFLLR